LQTPLAAAPMSGLLTKAEIAQGSMSNSECFDPLARSFETRPRPRFLAATLATLPSMSLFPKAPFGLSVYNPPVSSQRRLRGLQSQTGVQREFKSCMAIPLLYAGGAGNGLVKFRCRQIAAGGE
jgi:hypothetical protein